jgi:type III pantothenate kinase
MLLAIDVGNTNITLALFQGEELTASFRMMTKQPRTSDEFGIMICNLIEHRKYRIEDVADIIIASVVPNVMYSLTNGIIKYFHKKPFIVGMGTRTGIKIITENPREIGPDRIVDAVAAYDLYGGPVIVIDFGTATTYDLISEDGAFAAGITAPGIRISAKALWEDAARLPEIEIKKPSSILAKETISSMQAGLVYGCIGQTEYIVKRIKEESGLKNIKTVATGGLGKMIADETDCIDVYDINLTMKGLYLIYQKSKGK